MDRAMVQAALKELEAAGLKKRRRISDSPSGPEMVLDGREIIAFSGNDYLGLASDPRVLEAFIAGARKYGTAPAASPLMCGYTRAHYELEQACAEFTRRDRAIFFSTGYQANLGAVSALFGRGDVIFGDKLLHASLIDAAQLSGAKFVRYQHLDTRGLERRILETEAKSKLILTESVFSMEGDKPSMPELVELARRTGSMLYLDEAHGFGVLGKTGRGLAEEDNLTQDDVHLVMGAFGKAVGSFGAFVAGSEDLIEYILQVARTHTFSTASPAALAYAAMASLKIIQTEPERRERLNANIAMFRKKAAALNLPLFESQTPVQPVLVGSTEACLAISKLLWDRGIHVPGVRPPTVSPGMARMRVSVTAAHEERHIDRIMEVFEEAQRTMPDWTMRGPVSATRMAVSS